MSSATIKKQAISGTAWTILGYGTSQSLRLGSNLILTRLLVPELFGLMALVSVFLMGLNLFSDVGIYPSIIQNKRGEDPTFLNTAWTIQVIRGFGLWIGCLLIAFPVAQFYEEPRLQLLLPIVGLNSIINGFNSTNLPILQRRMEIGKLIRFELGIQIISLVVMITWAWFSPSIWALVVGNLVSTTVEMILESSPTEKFFSRFCLGQRSNQRTNFLWQMDLYLYCDDVSSFGDRSTGIRQAVYLGDVELLYYCFYLC